MANTAYASLNTRPHWAGTNADLDIHLEAYEGEIEGSFRVESMFRGMGLTNYKSVANASNTYRGDRVGGATVKGRQSGTALDNQRIPNEKYLVTVDTVSYVRSTLDLQDEWTAPDFQAEYSAEHGTAHAKAFDQAHLIQLIKCGAWVAPTSLKNSGEFFDGISKTLTGYTAETNMSAKADYIVKYHKDSLADFVKRDLGGSLAEFVSLISPDWFNGESATPRPRRRGRPPPPDAPPASTTASAQARRPAAARRRCTRSSARSCRRRRRRSCP